ncbi:hypothetical protein K8R61_02160 [bacterium]|nr:hypothetical protein [bacterium]
MGKIINISEARQKKNPTINNPFNELLRNAIILKKCLPELKDKIEVVDQQKLKRVFEGKISKIIIQRKLAGEELFLCGIYVSNLLCEMQSPKSWVVIDYIIDAQENPTSIKEGANICFLISSIFNERGDWRCMNLKNYNDMGMSLYHQFYTETGNEIGYYMSKQYVIIAKITKECIDSL